VTIDIVKTTRNVGLDLLKLPSHTLHAATTIGRFLF
jgi:hypothetical protein